MSTTMPKPPAGVRVTGQQQQQADDANRNNQIGGDGEEANNLGDDEKHAPLPGISRPYFFFHAA